MNKKLLICALIGCMLLSLAACGTSPSTPDSASDSAPSSKEEYTIRVAFENNPGEPVYMAVEKWVELAAEKTDGRLKLEMYPSSALGNKKDITEQIMMGADLITISDCAALMDYAPDVGIAAAPYLVDSFDQLDKLTASDWFKEASQPMEEKGLTVLASNWHYGVMHMMTKKPVSSPADLKGMKIRCPSSAFYISGIEAMGATPTPMALSDVYTSLSQDIVDGLFNPVPVLYSGNYHEQCGYLDLTGHIYLQSIWIGSKSYMDSLPEDIYQALLESGYEAGAYVNEINEEQYESALQNMVDAGVEVVEVDTEAFREMVQPLYHNNDEWSEGLYEKVQEVLNG